MVYLITYDLQRPGQDYAALHEAIKECGAWWHHLESTWMVDTGLDAEGIWNRLRPHIDNNDNILITRVRRDYAGWLPKDAWTWINTRLREAA